MSALLQGLGGPGPRAFDAVPMLHLELLRLWESRVDRPPDAARNHLSRELSLTWRSTEWRVDCARHGHEVFGAGLFPHAGHRLGSHRGNRRRGASARSLPATSSRDAYNTHGAGRRTALPPGVDASRAEIVRGVSGGSCITDASAAAVSVSIAEAAAPQPHSQSSTEGHYFARCAGVLAHRAWHRW